MPPVGQLQLPADTSHDQSTHWFALQRDLQTRAGSLTPAEELQLRLLQDLQRMHHQQLEQAKQVDSEKRQHSALQDEVLKLRKALGSASNPVPVPSQSPAGHQVHVDSHPQVDRLSVPPHPAKSGYSTTAAAPTTAAATHQSHYQPARLQALNAQSRPTVPRTTVPQRVTWLSEAQQISQQKSRETLNIQRQEQIAYTAQQNLLAEEAQDLAIIKAAMARSQQRQQTLAQLNTSTAPTAPPAQPNSANTPEAALARARNQLNALRQTPGTASTRTSRPSRQDELRFAALTSDKELLRTTSDRCRSDEPVSSDNESEILSEVPASVAAARLFSTKKAPLKSLRDQNGYIPNAFVKRDDEESPAQSVDRDVEGSSPEYDGDPSSDYYPSSRSHTPTPSLSASERQDYERLKRAESLRQRDQRGQGQQDNVTHEQPRYNISIAEPPEHGEWNDIHHLITVFKDKHVKYVKRCGKGDSLSVWECYTETAQMCILRQLKENDADTTRDADFMAGLTDAQLYTLLQNELGISYDMEVEQALSAIPFLGSILDKPSWVNFHTKWTGVLKRVTDSGRVQPKRMADIFRESIPDDFMQSWLKARRHLTWELAYEAAVNALLDPKWHTCYNKHVLTKISKPDSAKDSAKAKQANQAPPPAKPAAAQDKADKVDEKQAKLNFPASNNKNVNPNFKSDLDDNPSKAKCDRCAYIHKWPSALCTNTNHAVKGTKISSLTPDELKARLQQRWDKGYYFSKDIAALTYTSPSAGGAAAASASASKKIADSTKNGNA
jgi:hypothetical protein